MDAADRLIRRTQPQYDKVLQPEALRNAGLIGSNMFLTQQNINNLFRKDLEWASLPWGGME